MKTVLLILFAHFVADFIFQTDKQAINKSSSNWWLTLHVLTYGIGLIVVSPLIGFTTDLFGWVVTNMILHWGVDWCTSRLNAYLWKKNQRHWFFVGIGIDQFIHYCCLLLTFEIYKS